MKEILNDGRQVSIKGKISFLGGFAILIKIIAPTCTNCKSQNQHNQQFQIEMKNMQTFTHYFVCNYAFPIPSFPWASSQETNSVTDKEME